MHFTRRAVSPRASFGFDRHVATVNSSLSRRPRLSECLEEDEEPYLEMRPPVIQTTDPVVILEEEEENDSIVMSVARSVRVHFAVDVENLQSHQSVYVVGSTDALGAWEANRAMPLVQDPERSIRWKGFIETDVNQLKFRYVIGYNLMSEQGEKLVIDKWEAFLHPRTTLCSVENRNGECRLDRTDIFGYYAGRKVVSDGWLQHADENQVLLRLHGNALKFYKTSKERKNCRVKLTPLDVRYKQAASGHISFSYGEDEEDDDDDQTTPPSNRCTHSATHVAVLSDPRPKFYDQDDTGVVFNNNKDYVVFRTHSLAAEFLAFYIEIFSEERKRIGACYALPSSLQDASGVIHLPFINSTGRPIGQLSLEYLCVRALTRLDGPQLMEHTFCRHWKKRNALEVGHRGAGNSYTKFAMARENTIHSLNTAAKNGADYVEFDVQLTKDRIAVIYHDFHVLVSVARRDGHAAPPPMTREQLDSSNLDFHELPVKDLKLSQLKLLMLDHLSFPQKKENVKKLVEAGEEEEDFKPFPTLVEALTKVDPDVGFNVEVKYPMMQNNGEHECDHYFERNLFVDIILEDVLKHAANRRIMFSSFDPDICSMVATKQNKYPVLFLCVGETQRYTPFQDQRTSTSMTAVNFAVGADLLGVNFNSEDLLKDPMPVKKANEFGMVTFVWGEDLDKKENIDYFKKELGVDGVIYDRIGEEERRRNVFIVEREQKRALLSCSGASTPQRAVSPTPSGHATENNNTSPANSSKTLGRKNNSDPTLLEVENEEEDGVESLTDKLGLTGFQSAPMVSTK